MNRIWHRNGFEDRGTFAALRGLVGALRALSAVVLLAMCAVAASCASAPQFVDHAFSFDAFADKWDAELLDYRYGTAAMTRTPDWEKRTNRVNQGTNINGGMLRGNDLYVKWRIKETGEVLEDTVDLRDKLPHDIRDHRIHFLISGKQLLVYVISPERRPTDWPANGPRRYQHLKVVTVYPITPSAK